MKLFRRKSAAPSRRQRLRDEGLLANTPIFSYRSRRSQTERNDGRQVTDDEVSTRARSIGRFWLHRFGLLILLIALVASAVHVLSLSSQAKVLPLVNASNQSLLGSPAAYQASANRLLAASIWNRSKLTINTDKLAQQLRNQFPELASVSVTVPLLTQQPLIYVEPAQPVLVLIVKNNDGFVVDNNGRAVARNVNFQSGGLVQLHDQSGLKIQLNQQALPASYVRFMQVILAELAAKQIVVAGMVLPAATSELDVQIAGQPYFIKFNLQSTNPRGQAGTFLAAIAGLKRQGITPAKYVDVRVDGRAYYQ